MRRYIREGHFDVKPRRYDFDFKGFYMQDNVLENPLKFN
jgi:hypothetical protein